MLRQTAQNVHHLWFEMNVILAVVDHIAAWIDTDCAKAEAIGQIEFLATHDRLPCA
jgi:hypothetical protein